MERFSTKEKLAAMGIATGLALGVASEANAESQQIPQNLDPEGKNALFLSPEQQESQNQNLQAIEIFTPEGELVIKTPQEIDSQFFDRIRDNVENAENIFNQLADANNIEDRTHRIVVSATITEVNGVEVATSTPTSTPAETPPTAEPDYDVDIFVSFPGAGIWVPKDPEAGTPVYYISENSEALASINLQNATDEELEGLYFAPITDGEAVLALIDREDDNKVLAKAVPNKDTFRTSWEAELMFDHATGTYIEAGIIRGYDVLQPSELAEVSQITEHDRPYTTGVDIYLDNGSKITFVSDADVPKIQSFNTEMLNYVLYEMDIDIENDMIIQSIMMDSFPPPGTDAGSFLQPWHGDGDGEITQVYRKPMKKNETIVKTVYNSQSNFDTFNHVATFEYNDQTVSFDLQAASFGTQMLVSIFSDTTFNNSLIDSSVEIIDENFVDTNTGLRSNYFTLKR